MPPLNETPSRIIASQTTLPSREEPQQCTGPSEHTRTLIGRQWNPDLSSSASLAAAFSSAGRHDPRRLTLLGAERALGAASPCARAMPHAQHSSHVTRDPPSLAPLRCTRTLQQQQARHRHVSVGGPPCTKWKHADVYIKTTAALLRGGGGIVWSGA